MEGTVAVVGIAAWVEPSRDRVAGDPSSSHFAAEE